MNTGLRGDSACLLASAKLVEVGVTILKPVSECLKFDLVAYDSVGFKTLQVKRAYPSKTEGKWNVSLRRVSMTSKGPVAKSYSKDDVDIVIAVVVELGILYCFPISEVAGRNLITLNPNGLGPKTKNKIDTESFKNIIHLHSQIYKL